MRGVLDGGFDLLISFGSAHVMIAGILLGLIGALASGIVWLTRKNVLKALPGLALVLLVPAMVIGIIPGFEALDVPLALGLLVLAFYLHIKPGEGKTKTDGVLSIILGLALLAFLIVQGLSMISSQAG